MSGTSNFHTPSFPLALPPMLATLGTMWLIQVPLAYFIPRYTELGVYGVRWAIVMAIVMRGIIYSIYFKGGWWKGRKV